MNSLRLFITSHLLAFESSYAKYIFLFALKDVPSSGMIALLLPNYLLEQLVWTHPFLQNILQRIISEPVSSIEGKIVELLLQQYSPPVTQLLNTPNNEYMRTMLSLLRTVTTNRDAMETLDSAKLTLLSCFTDNFWCGLSDDNQILLFDVLLELLQDQSLKIKDKAHEILKTIPVDSSVLGHFLSLNYPNETSTRYKRRKQSGESVNEYLHYISWLIPAGTTGTVS